MYDTQSDTSSSSGSDSSGKTFFSRTVEHIINGKPGKMFVGGLNTTTSSDNLKFYFSKFGSVEEAMVMRDAKTKLSRGFGFVIFFDPKVIDEVCAIKNHFLDGKKIDPQPAIRTISPARSVHNVYKKLFIGGVSQSITSEDLKEYFMSFGEVEDVVLKKDFSKDQHRGFGFITFFDDAVSDLVCSIRYHKVAGKIVETKPALKKEFVQLESNSRLNPNAAPFVPCGLTAQSTSSNLFAELPAFDASSYLSIGESHIKESSFLQRIAAKYL